MAGNPAVLDGASEAPAILPTADHPMVVAVKLPTFWVDNIEMWLV